MTAPGEIQGVALWCDHDGRILEVLREEVGLGDKLRPGTPFRMVCDPLSRRKFDHLLTAVKRDHAVYDWPLQLRVADALHTVHVAAGLDGGRILLIAVRNPTMVDTLYEELIRMSGDQATSLRTALKELSLRDRSSAQLELDDDAPDLEAFARLNNELMRVQRELARRNMELERLSRDKDRFVGMAAHDLRQPLSAIISMAELLHVGAFGLLSSDQGRVVDTIRTSSESMLELVNDLLDVSVIESGKLELRCALTPVARLLENVEATYRAAAAAKDITIQLEYRPQLPDRVWLDENRMAQALGNLVSNAIKYSHPGTAVALGASLDGDLLRLEVTDQGQGIPEHELELLFQPFATTSVQTTGGETSTGLGLTICQRVVREHGGRITVESQAGAGSCFRIELPWQRPGHLHQLPE